VQSKCRLRFEHQLFDGKPARKDNRGISAPTQTFPFTQMGLFIQSSSNKALSISNIQTICHFQRTFQTHFVILKKKSVLIFSIVRSLSWFCPKWPVATGDLLLNLHLDLDKSRIVPVTTKIWISTRNRLKDLSHSTQIIGVTVGDGLTSLRMSKWTKLA
jgi:hypothetical protein